MQTFVKQGGAPWRCALILVLQFAVIEASISAKDITADPWKYFHAREHHLYPDPDGSWVPKRGSALISPSVRDSEKPIKERFLLPETSHSSRLWNNQRVPYKFHEGLDWSIREKIRGIMINLQDFSCTTFVERDDEVMYLYIVPSYRCTATVGQMEGARMEIGDDNGRLWGYDCASGAVLSHLLLKVLGLTEDHQSLRRHEHVRIYFEHMDRAAWGEFRKKPSLVTRAYEPDGIMHIHDTYKALSRGTTVEHLHGYSHYYMFGPWGDDDFTNFGLYHISDSLHQVYPCDDCVEDLQCVSGVPNAVCAFYDQEEGVCERQCSCWCFLGYNGHQCQRKTLWPRVKFFDVTDMNVNEQFTIIGEKVRDAVSYMYIKRSPDGLHPLIEVRGIFAGCLSMRWGRYDENIQCDDETHDELRTQRPKFASKNDLVLEFLCYARRQCSYDILVTAVNNRCAHLAPCSPESTCVDSNTENNVYRCECNEGFEGEHCYQVYDAIVYDNFDGHGQYFDFLDLMGNAVTFTQYPGEAPDDINGPPYDHSTGGVYRYQLDEFYSDYVYHVGYYMIVIPEMPAARLDRVGLQTKFTFHGYSRCLHFSVYMVGECDNMLEVYQWKDADQFQILWVHVGKRGVGQAWENVRVDVPYDPDLDGYKIRFVVTLADNDCYLSNSVSIDEVVIYSDSCNSQHDSKSTCQNEAVVELGQACESDETCTYCGIPNSECLAGFCTCQYNYYGELGESLCRPKIPLGDECEISSDCIAETANSECRDFVCHCAEGYDQAVTPMNHHYCRKIVGGTQCRDEHDSFCSTPSCPEMICDLSTGVCVCPPMMVYVRSLDACHHRANGPQCHPCKRTTGRCFDVDGDTVADGCDCFYPMPSLEDALLTGCQQLYGELDEECRPDGTITCLPDNSECRHVGGLSTEYVCQCQSGYVAVDDVENPTKKQCYTELSVEEDHRCAVCITNGGQCYDTDNDGGLDGCLCPLSRTSSKSLPENFCDTPIVDVVCERESLTVCFKPWLHPSCPSASQTLATGDSALHITDRADESSCHFQQADGSWCIVMDKSDGSSCQPEFMSSRRRNVFYTWFDFRCSSQMASVYDICVFVYCEYYTMVDVAVGYMVQGNNKMRTSVGRTLSPVVEMKIKDQFGQKTNRAGMHKGVHLVAQVTQHHGVFTSMKAEVCVVSDEPSLLIPDANMIVLIEGGCPHHDTPMKDGLVFIPDPHNRLFMKTESFKLFTLGGSNVLYFHCAFRVCINANVNECMPSDCWDDDGRRKRRSAPDLTVVASLFRDPDYVTSVSAVTVDLGLLQRSKGGYGGKIDQQPLYANGTVLRKQQLHNNKPRSRGHRIDRNNSTRLNVPLVRSRDRQSPVSAHKKMATPNYIDTPTLEVVLLTMVWLIILVAFVLALWVLKNKMSDSNSISRYSDKPNEGRRNPFISKIEI